jgi:hypothetical protein
MPEIGRENEYKLLVNKLIEYFNSSTYSKIEVKLPPLIYAPEKVLLLKEILLKSGFKLSYTEINQSIELNRKFNLYRGAKHKLNLAEAYSLKFQLQSSLSTELIYKFLAESRTQSGYPVTITFQGLVNLLSELPERTFTSAVYNSEGIFLAIGIVLKLRKDYWYTLYLADNHGFRKLSPTTFLVRQIAKNAQFQGVKTLDLGISTEYGVANPGLMNFKESLGATQSEQFVFEYCR